MNPRTVLSAIALYAVSTFPVYANHPGADLDKVMEDKEQYFQVIDKADAPSFELVDANLKVVRLSDFVDKIVILNFIYASCPDVCPLHAEKIAEIQKLINVSPMKDMVQFISITTDPANDSAQVLKDYGPAHGLDPVNWVFLTAPPDQPEDTTRKMAKAYRMEFTKTDNGMRVHGVVTQIIDRGGRFAAKFHGLKFKPLNLILYVNGLINNAHTLKKKPQAGWWERLKGVF